MVKRTQTDLPPRLVEFLVDLVADLEGLADDAAKPCRCQTHHCDHVGTAMIRVHRARARELADRGRALLLPSHVRG